MRGERQKEGQHGRVGEEGVGEAETIREGGRAAGAADGGVRGRKGCVKCVPCVCGVGD